jgi:HAD superfamily hydrolase (TIGR01509 family)
MLEGIVFDMDGVLIDSHPVHRAAWRKFLSSLGRQVDDRGLDFIMEGRRRDEILRHFLGDLPVEVVAEYGRIKDRFFQEKFDSIALIPGIMAFLSHLKTKGIPAAVATSASANRTRATLCRLNLEHLFVAVVTGDDVPVGKPNPAIYQLVAQRMALPLETLLVLEDAPSGVEAAIAAGMRCIGVGTNGRTDALIRAGAEHVIPNFLGLSVRKIFTLWNASGDKIGNNGQRKSHFRPSAFAR